MRNYARKRATRGKVAYRTPSRYRAQTARALMMAKVGRNRPYAK